MAILKINYTLLVGRALLGSLFILSALNKIQHWETTVFQVRQKVFLLEQFISTELFNDAIAFDVLGLSSTLLPFIIGAGTVCELVCGLMVSMGLQHRIGALALVAITAISTFVMHNPYMSSYKSDTNDVEFELSMVSNNIALIGGLLVLSCIKRRPVNAKHRRSSSSSSSSHSRDSLSPSASSAVLRRLSRESFSHDDNGFFGDDADTDNDSNMKDQ